MALKSCKECGAQVSTKADKCPQCGAPVKREPIKAGPGCLLIIVVFIVGFWIQAQLDSGYDQPAREAAPATEPTAEGSYTGSVTDVQVGLKALGYDPGPIDGVLGPSTERAIRSYQQDEGIAVDGKVTAALKKRLLAEAAAKAETAPNPAHAMLMQRPPEERPQWLALIVNEGESTCLYGRDAFFQGFDSEQNAYWNVTCENGEAYMIQVLADSDGTTRILSCEVQRALGSECYVRF